MLGFVLAGSGVAAGGVAPTDGDSAEPGGNLSTQASFGVSIVNVTAPVEGEQLTVTAEISNTGAAGAQVVVADAGPLGEANRTVTLDAGASTQVELTIDTEIQDAEDGPYTLTVASADSAASTAVDVTLPTIGSANSPPQDLDGDSLYEDFTLDGVFTIFDVQAFFTSFGNPSVQTHSWAYNFDESPDGAATIFDVQSLFVDLSSGGIDPQAPFAVSLTDVDTEVPVGETFSVGYEVENTGVRADTQEITFSVDGFTEETRDVTLAPEETTTGTFTSVAGPNSVPGVGVSVASRADSAVETVLVSNSAALNVTLTGVDSEVVAGETATVDYEVTNTGGVETTQTVEFAVNGTVEDTADVTLGGGETFDGTFGYVTDTDDVPAVDLSVSSANDTATESVTVLEPAAFAVTLTDTPTDVVAGETVAVDYEVTNTGDVAATQTVEFAVNGSVENTTGVTLDGGETFTGGFSYETGTGDVPGLTVSVSSANETTAETVTVLEPAAFAVTITGTNSSVVAGETVAVDYEVTNTGDVEATQTVAFAVNGTVEDTTSVTVEGGETFTGGFSYETDIGDVPGLNVSVSSANDTTAETVTVLEPAVFAVTITDVEEPVIAGSELAVSYSVTNDGDVEATQTVAFSVNGTTEDTTDVTLTGGETVTGMFAYATGSGDIPQVSVEVASADDSDTATANVSQGDILAVTVTGVPDEVVAGDATRNGTFSYETAPAEVPEVQVEVASEDDTATRVVGVLAPAEFTVSITDAPADVAAGETVTVDYEVTNAGDAEATQTVEFAVNGSVENTTTVTLSGGEGSTGTFTYLTGSADIPAISVAVASEDDTTSQTVEVLAPAEFTVSITALDDAVVAGETVTVDYEVTNTGGAGATRNVTFAVNETVEGKTAVTLDGGETFAGTFSYQTDPGDTPAVVVAVASPDDNATGTVTVSEPAFLDVTITTVDTEVVSGETVTLEYEVTNTGDVEATQTVEFAVNGSVENTTTVTLGGGESTTGAFGYDTGETDTPGIEVAVSSANDTATETVTVLAPATFAVTLTAVDQEVVEGDEVTVDYEVANTGDIEDTQTVDFTVDGGVTNQTTVTLTGGETFAGTFGYQTGSGDAPDLEVAVSSANDTATETVAVLEPAVFAVSITDAPTEVVAGETVTVDYEVTNTGDAEDTQTVAFTVDGTTENMTTVTLDGGESTTGAFGYDTSETDTPSVEVAVSSDDDTADRTVTVEEPAFLAVSLTSVTGEVTAGETVTVDYEVTNTGDVEATQTLALSINGSVENTTSVTLTGGETVTGGFSYDTTDSDAPGIEAEVSSANDTAAETVTVNEPAFFDVTLDADSVVMEGETVTVNYTVQNTGDTTDSQNITFAVNGTTEATSSVALGGGGTDSGTFTYDTSIGDSPAVEVAVASEDEEETATVTVENDDPDITASLGDAQGGVGDVVEVDIDIVSFDGGGGDGFGSYQLGISFDDSVLSFEGVVAGGFSQPTAVNSDNGSIAMSEFSASGTTPLEPALTLEFEILADGTSTVAFDDDSVNGGNQLNNGSGDAYKTQFEDGTAGTSTSASRSRRVSDPIAGVHSSGLSDD